MSVPYLLSFPHVNSYLSPRLVFFLPRGGVEISLRRILQEALGRSCRGRRGRQRPLRTRIYASYRALW